MPKRYMSKQEYEEQQFRYRHSLKDPSLLSEIVDGAKFIDELEDENKKQAKQDLLDQLFALIYHKIETELTPRQKEAVRLYLLSKKQEHIATILGISQEAVNSRIKLGKKKLKELCNTDEDIQAIWTNISQ